MEDGPATIHGKGLASRMVEFQSDCGTKAGGFEAEVETADACVQAYGGEALRAGRCHRSRWAPGRRVQKCLRRRSPAEDSPAEKARSSTGKIRPHPGGTP